MQLLGLAGAGYAAVPLAVALETVGVPVPAEATLIAAAVLSARGGLSIEVVIMLAAAGAIVGDNVGYALGRRLGRRALLAPGPFARGRRRLVEGGDRFFAAHGRAAVFLGRWVAIGRMATAWLAGADRMPWRRFAVWNALGGVAWATSIGLVAYALGTAGARWLAVAGTAVTLVMLARLGGLHRWVVRAPAAVRAAARRYVLVVLGVGAAATGFVVFVLPALAGAGAEWRRIRHGDPAWLSLAVAAEIASYAGYVALLRAVFRREVGWRMGFLITMAGVAATRLFATAGAGGIALTSWALHRLGVPTRRVVRGTIAFLATLYVVYVAALLVLGLGLGLGIVGGADQPLLTLVPAGLAAAVIAAGALTARAPAWLRPRLIGLARRARPLRRPAEWLAAGVADAGAGIGVAFALVRGRPLVLLGALAWWGFDVAALAAAFHAFGSAPALPVLLMAYALGMLGNLLPLPGGVGGVEGGMIGAFAAFGEPAGTALVAVLAYRLASFWLPTLVGAPAYLVLRRALGPRPYSAGRSVKSVPQGDDGSARAPDHRQPCVDL